MKQVIFVGGNAFSGTTFFHLILANDPKGFACGEAAALFRPGKPHHTKLVSNLTDKACRELWKRAYVYGEGLLYETIFDLRPNVEFIVDSSKSPFWIQAQNENLKSKGIQYKNILIWKTPLEFAHSLKKRNRLQNWDKKWLNYHRQYFSLIRNWRAVKYGDFIVDTTILEKVCQYLEIPVCPGKEEYWTKEYCHLGGNKSARFHLLSHQEAERLLLTTHDEKRMHLYKHIYRSEVDDCQLVELVDRKVNSSKRFESIMKLLSQHDVFNNLIQETEAKDAQFPSSMIQLRRVKYEFKSLLGNIRYRPEFEVP